MSAWRIWLRRSLAPRLAPLYLVAALWAQYSVTGWQYEWEWGLRAPMRFLVLVAPLLAAAVAFDVARWQPVAPGLGPSTRRWRAATLAVPAAHVAWAFGCIALVSATAAGRLALDHAMGRPDLWLPAELLAAQVAAASVGLVLGTLAPPGLAGPAAAVVVFATGSLGGALGLMNAFSPMGAAGSLLALERNPPAAAFAVLLDVAVVVLALVIALRRSAHRAFWGAGVVVAAARVLALVAVPGSALPPECRPVAGQEACVTRGGVSVCGPDIARRHLADVAGALQEATSTLAGSGLPLPDRYVLATPGSPPEPAEPRTLAWASPGPAARRPPAGCGGRGPLHAARLPGAVPAGAGPRPAHAGGGPGARLDRAGAGRRRWGRGAGSGAGRLPRPVLLRTRRAGRPAAGPPDVSRSAIGPLVVGWLRSRRFPVLVALWTGVAGVGAASAQDTVQIPLLKNPVQVPEVLLVVVAVFVAVPLPDRFGLLERSFAGAAVDRAVAAVLACGLSVAALLPATTLDGFRFP